MPLTAGCVKEGGGRFIFGGCWEAGLEMAVAMLGGGCWPGPNRARSQQSSSVPAHRGTTSVVEEKPQAPKIDSITDARDMWGTGRWLI